MAYLVNVWRFYYFKDLKWKYDGPITQIIAVKKYFPVSKRKLPLKKSEENENCMTSEQAMRREIRENKKWC